MIALTLGLLLFLGVHSIRIFANVWRARQLTRLGARRWKALYGLASLAGLALVIWGFGVARSEPVVLWSPPKAIRHLTAAVTLVAFVLIAAAYVPGNHIKAKVGHPMVLGVMTWALAHLLANGTVAHVILFGGFFLCAGADFFPRAPATAQPAGAIPSRVRGVMCWR